MGVADNTRKSTKSRLNTWDFAITTLEEKGLIGPPEDPTFLTPELVKAGVAYLKARGYRSAELYLSAAMMRHRSKHEVAPPLTGAAREATRAARRGRGPACGKMPIELPQPNEWHYKALMTGIWYLLRISELTALDVGDVHKKQGPNGWQVAVHVRQSKTDQEAVGEYVARECICHKQTEGYCPAHILWSLVDERAQEVKEMGGDPTRAPLLVTEQGCRVTMEEIRRAVEGVAERQGHPLRVQGRNQFGTHSLRTTGAILAFTSGIHEDVVRSLGRWKTAKAMHCYLRGTPLAKSAEATQVMAKAMVRDEKGGTHTAFEPLYQSTGAEPKPVDLMTLEELRGTMMIRHGITGMVHRAGKMAGPAEAWSTWCGWRWSDCGTAGRFEASHKGELCQKCYARRG